jgi:mono/diheme cytochrome c family protein
VNTSRRHGRHLLAAVGWLVIAAVTTTAMAAHPANDTTDTNQIKRGHYLALAGDCAACHTAPGGKRYAGGLPVTTPVGAIISTNITPSKTAGIGQYTLQQFSDAVRRGIRADGKRLYPAMPYPAYSQLTDTDVKALYAYFMHGVPPVDRQPPWTRLPFPFNIRLSMMVWDAFFARDEPFTPNPNKSDAWNRGAYLVRGLTHCATCHSPRNLLMAVKSSDALAGASLGTWYAPNITPDAASGIGNWSRRDIVDYLKTGRAPGKAQAAGPMAEAVDNSLRHLSQRDLVAIATYLKTVPAQHDQADTRPADAWGAAYADLASIRGKALPRNPDKMSGAQLYDAHCSTCHQDRGQGSFHGGLPPLFHNTATGRRNPDNLVMVILQGIQWHTNGSGIHMPGFASELSNRQVATLANYLTQHFGNPAAKVSVDRVRELRAGGASSHLVLIAQVLVIVILVIIALIIAAIVLAVIRRRRRHATATPRH